MHANGAGGPGNAGAFSSLGVGGEEKRGETKKKKEKKKKGKERRSHEMPGKWQRRAQRVRLRAAPRLNAIGAAEAAAAAARRPRRSRPAGRGGSLPSTQPNTSDTDGEYCTFSVHLSGQLEDRTS